MDSLSSSSSSLLSAWDSESSRVSLLSEELCLLGLSRTIVPDAAVTIDAAVDLLVIEPGFSITFSARQPESSGRLSSANIEG